MDNISIKEGSKCKGHCTFEGGFCGWINDEDDDFNWSLVKIQINTIIIVYFKMKHFI